MKKSITIILASLVLSCTSKAQKKEFSAEALSENLIAYDGTPVAFKEVLNKHIGKTLVIEVWASWCGDCVKAMPKVKELQANHPEAEFIFISMDKTKEKWHNGIEKYKLTGNHYMAKDQMKGVFGKAIDLDWIPRYIILDKTGKIVIYRAIESDFEKINENLNKLK